MRLSAFSRAHRGDGPRFAVTTTPSICRAYSRRCLASVRRLRTAIMSSRPLLRHCRTEHRLVWQREVSKYSLLQSSQAFSKYNSSDRCFSQPTWWFALALAKTSRLTRLMLRRVTKSSSQDEQASYTNETISTEHNSITVAWSSADIVAQFDRSQKPRNGSQTNVHHIPELCFSHQAISRSIVTGLILRGRRTPPLIWNPACPAVPTSSWSPAGASGLALAQTPPLSLALWGSY